MPTAYSQTVVDAPVQAEKDESKFYSKDYMMLAISIISPIVSIVAGWKITKWYYEKKNEPDEIFKQTRKEKLESLRDRTGQSFSIFKKEFGHILEKKSIVKQDLVVYSSKDYSELVKTLQHNHKNITDREDSYEKWVNRKEISKYTNFFTYMLWWIGVFQQKTFNENDIEHVNEIMKKIKSVSHEFDGVSHEFSFSSTLSSEDSRKLHRGEDFNSPT